MQVDRSERGAPRLQRGSRLRIVQADADAFEVIIPPPGLWRPRFWFSSLLAAILCAMIALGMHVEFQAPVPLILAIVAPLACFAECVLIAEATGTETIRLSPGNLRMLRRSPLWTRRTDIPVPSVLAIQIDEALGGEVRRPAAYVKHGRGRAFFAQQASLQDAEWLVRALKARVFQMTGRHV